MAGAGDRGNLAKGSDAVLYQPIMIAFPGAYAVTTALTAALSSLLWDNSTVWALFSAIVVSILIHTWDQATAAQSRVVFIVWNALLLWLTVAGFLSLAAVVGTQP